MLSGKKKDKEAHFIENLPHTTGIVKYLDKLLNLPLKMDVWCSAIKHFVQPWCVLPENKIKFFLFPTLTQYIYNFENDSHRTTQTNSNLISLSYSCLVENFYGIELVLSLVLGKKHLTENRENNLVWTLHVSKILFSLVSCWLTDWMLMPHWELSV